MSILILMATTGYAQDSTIKPAFEVAVIRAIHDYPPEATMNGDISHGRLILNNAHIKQMIAVAYEIHGVLIEGGPAWINTAQFQIEGKAEDPNASEAQVRRMLQTLLEQRFRLRIHRETRTMSSYSLVTGVGGGKVPQARDGGTDRCDRTRKDTGYQLTCEHIELQTLANALAVLLRSPVTDRTGLGGDYDFTLNWDSDDPYAAVPEALEKYGLKLEMKKAATEVLVIDSIDKPSEN